MAAQSNINVAREFIMANKQALADMGVAAKELDKIFKSLEDDLDKLDKLNKDQLETYKKAVEFVRERAAVENEVTKQKKKQKNEETALDKQIKNSVNSINEKYNAGHKYLRAIPGIGKALSGVFDTFGPYIDQYNEFFEKSLRKTADGSTDKIAKTGAQKLGAGILAFGKKAFDTMTELGLDMGQTVGLGFQVFFGEQLKAVTEEFGSINDSSLKLVGRMKLFSFLTGTSADDLAKTVGLMAATSNLSNEQLMSQIETTKQMAQQAGIPIKGVMADIAGNAEFTAKFMKDSGQNIMNAALHAKKLGINLGDVASISNSLLDFESSIEKQMEAQVLLGRNINVDRARQLAFTGDTEGLMKEVTRLAGSEAEFNKMNVIQREALAGAVGLSVEKLSALVRTEKAGNEETQSKFKWYVGIGAAAIGIASAIIGALTMGLGVKASLKGALKGGIGGGLVGAGIGASAHSIMNSSKVPKLAGGGIVNSPMLAMVGEKGPEAVVPLGAGGAKVDMKETNELLRALLGSSEKQVNRLGDIGTS